MAKFVGAHVSASGGVENAPLERKLVAGPTEDVLISLMNIPVAGIQLQTLLVPRLMPMIRLQFSQVELLLELPSHVL